MSEWDGLTHIQSMPIHVRRFLSPLVIPSSSILLHCLPAPSYSSHHNRAAELTSIQTHFCLYAKHTLEYIDRQFIAFEQNVLHHWTQHILNVC